jgi:hypothetical protein
MAVEPFPFASLDELKQRWPDLPVGADAHATVLLEDASQFILDTVPTAIDAAANTRRRIVCSVVRRAMQAGEADTGGLDTMQVGAGPFQFGGKVSDSDFYLKKAEKVALGAGATRAFGVQVAGPVSGTHLPWCNLNFGATYCSCGVDIAGEPIFEGA